MVHSKSMTHLAQQSVMMFLTVHILIADETVDTDMACCHKVVYSQESTLHPMSASNTTYIDYRTERCTCMNTVNVVALILMAVNNKKMVDGIKRVT